MTQKQPVYSSEHRKLHDIVDDMISEETIEDRREYSETDLRRMYDLSEEEASDLAYLIKRLFDPSLQEEYQQRGASIIPSWIHKEYLMEAEHGGFEGFTEHESIILQKWFDDMWRYWASIKDERQKDGRENKEVGQRSTYGSEDADT